MRAGGGRTALEEDCCKDCFWSAPRARRLLAGAARQRLELLARLADRAEAAAAAQREVPSRSPPAQSHWSNRPSGDAPLAAKVRWGLEPLPQLRLSAFRLYFALQTLAPFFPLSGRLMLEFKMADSVSG